MKIQHDFHIHTNLSVCAKREATLEGYIEAGKKLGLKKMGFSDHFWDESIPFSCNNKGIDFYSKQGYEHVLSIKDRIKKLTSPDLQLYFGCEVEYAHGIKAPAISEAVAEQFDFIIVPNSHTHLAMDEKFYQPYSKHAEYMLDAYESIVTSPLAKYVTAVAHPFEAVCCPYPRNLLFRLISDDSFKRVFSKTADAGIAVEINLECLLQAMESPEEWEQRLRMINIAKSMGCKFLFGSDAHSHLHFENLQVGSRISEALSIGESDIADICK